MSISYTWDVQRLECYKTIDGYQNVVINVQGVLVGNDGQEIGSADFDQSLIFSPGGTFTPFEELTPAQVIDWVQTAMPSSTVANLKVQIDQVIQSKKSNKELLPPPWVGPAT